MRERTIGIKGIQYKSFQLWFDFDYSRILFTPEEMKEFQFHAHKVPGAR